MNIAVVGGGPAGMTAAIFLKNCGFNVTIFEREKIAKPIGAGIFLQPTGLKVLDKLGLKENIVNNGVLVNRLNSQNVNGKPIFKLPFEMNELKGYGVHRSSLFSNLFDKVNSVGIEVVTDSEIVDIVIDKKKSTLVDKKGASYGCFDLVIVSAGRAIPIREKFDSIIKVAKKQTYGAFWCKLDYVSGIADNQIHHIYQGTQRMYGLMPIGYGDNEHLTGYKTNFFCGIHLDYVKDWNAQKFQKWKNESYKLAPSYASFLDQIQDIDQLILAPYYDVYLKRNHINNVVFIGDSAHALSPHLSSGTNLALLDALILTECLLKSDSIKYNLSRFSKERKEQVWYYYWVSQVITPLFQSKVDYSVVRDYVLKPMLTLAWTEKKMLETIMGIKKGVFSTIPEKYFK